MGLHFDMIANFSSFCCYRVGIRLHALAVIHTEVSRHFPVADIKLYRIRPIFLTLLLILTFINIYNAQSICFMYDWPLELLLYIRIYLCILVGDRGTCV